MQTLKILTNTLLVILGIQLLFMVIPEFIWGFSKDGLDEFGWRSALAFGLRIWLFFEVFGLIYHVYLRWIVYLPRRRSQKRFVDERYAQQNAH
ncbi:MAG: hypothetical protein IKZ87_08960 [Actinomycetaceae bacterium]|nr:hypothetical protein [Actinomycetaceae bacterium]